jgi:hypothetical protein
VVRELLVASRIRTPFLPTILPYEYSCIPPPWQTPQDGSPREATKSSLTTPTSPSGRGRYRIGGRISSIIQVWNGSVRAYDEGGTRASAAGR